MNLLQVFFIISWIVISIFAIEIAKKQKFNALHFFVFISIGLWLLIFTFFPSVLNQIWNIFWLQRWADILVYSSIIFLIYFSLLLLRKIESNREELTSLIREIAINNSIKKNIKWKEVILMRAYNEGKVIKKTIQELLENWIKNILIVNDGSTDNTLSIINSLNNENIILINHLWNRWAWAALETWFEYIRRYGEIDYIVTFDADWQHDVEDIKKIEKHLIKHEKVDVLIWSRFLSKRQVWMPFARKIILKLWIVFTFFLSSIKLSDSHNGFRVFRKKVLDDINLTIDWMWYASELIDIISSKKIPYKEIPVNITYSEYSLNKWQKNWNAFRIAMKMIRRKFFK
jgi:hypothetical protein